jgi:hypothetical protein
MSGRGGRGRGRGHGKKAKGTTLGSHRDRPRQFTNPNKLKAQNEQHHSDEEHDEVEVEQPQENRQDEKQEEQEEDTTRRDRRQFREWTEQLFEQAERNAREKVEKLKNKPLDDEKKSAVQSVEMSFFDVDRLAAVVSQAPLWMRLDFPQEMYSRELEMYEDEVKKRSGNEIKFSKVEAKLEEKVMQSPVKNEKKQVTNTGSKKSEDDLLSSLLSEREATEASSVSPKKATKQPKSKSPVSGSSKKTGKPSRDPSPRSIKQHDVSAANPKSSADDLLNSLLSEGEQLVKKKSGAAPTGKDSGSRRMEKISNQPKTSSRTISEKETKKQVDPLEDLLLQAETSSAKKTLKTNATEQEDELDDLLKDF